KPPKRTSGLANYRENERLREGLVSQWKTKSNIIYSGNLSADLLKLSVTPEIFSRYHLSFIRKKIKGGHLYFVSNFGKDKQNCTIQLAVKAKYITLYNPLTNQSGKALAGFTGKSPAVFLSLAPGESIFITATDEMTS